jgi:hypothetical protein
MIKITQRPVFEFEKQEYLKTLWPTRAGETINRVSYYIFWCLFLTISGAGLIVQLLQAVLRISDEAAMIAGLVAAFCGSVYVCLRLKRRRQAFYEKESARLDASVIETFDMDVRRAWKLDECSCCSMSYLLQVSDTELMFVETMRQTEAELKGFPARRMTIERERDTKTIWGMRNEGPPVSVEELEDFPAEDLGAYGSSECELLKLDELPEALRAKIAAH